jgi:hypothetical protein
MAKTVSFEVCEEVINEVLRAITSLAKRESAKMDATQFRQESRG